MKYTISDILKTFITKHNDLYTAMNRVDHAYNGDTPNKFHLEGTVWTHTMMVLMKANDAHASTVMLLSALCHDIGKAFVYKDIHDKKRRRFSSHEAVSTFYTREVLESFDLDLNEKARIMYIVANHGSMYNFFEDGRIPEKNYSKFMDRFRYDEFKDLTEFYHYDHEGRFFEVEQTDRCNQTVYDDFNKILDKMYDRYIKDVSTELMPSNSITVLIGPPRVGKSTWTKENVRQDEVIISRDFWVEQNGIGNNYSEKWESLSDEDQKTIDNNVQRDFMSALKDKRNIIIDMTNMSKKSRRKWLSDKRIKQYHKKAILFIESKSCLLSRNSPEKMIPERVIDIMMMNFVWPQHEEFDEVIYRDALC